jgi:hypothetical protein
MTFSFDHCVAGPSVSVLLAMVLLVFMSLFFGHCVVCPSVPFLLVIVLLFLLFLNDQKKMPEGEATQWPK